MPPPSTKRDERTFTTRFSLEHWNITDIAAIIRTLAHYMHTLVSYCLLDFLFACPSWCSRLGRSPDTDLSKTATLLSGAILSAVPWPMYASIHFPLAPAYPSQNTLRCLLLRTLTTLTARSLSLESLIAYLCIGTIYPSIAHTRASTLSSLSSPLPLSLRLAHHSLFLSPQHTIVLLLTHLSNQYFPSHFLSASAEHNSCVPLSFCPVAAQFALTSVRCVFIRVGERSA